MLAPDQRDVGESAWATDDHTQHFVGNWDIGAETAMTMRPTPAVIADVRLPFTTAGLLAGARQALPLALSGFAYGMVFGVLARQAGLDLTESLLMSGLVYAGSAQFVALELWTVPPPALTIVLTTLVVNLRLLLMGAVLRPWFARLRVSEAYGSVFFLSDEAWALTMRQYDRARPDAPEPDAPARLDGAFMLGAGLVLFGAWVSATLAGQVLGTFVDDPAAWGLDFAFVAVFIVLLVGMWRGRSRLMPWSIAALVAVIAERWLPGYWYILLGALAGSTLGAVLDAD